MVIIQSGPIGQFAVSRAETGTRREFVRVTAPPLRMGDDRVPIKDLDRPHKQRNVFSHLASVSTFHHTFTSQVMGFVPKKG